MGPHRPASRPLHAPPLSAPRRYANPSRRPRRFSRLDQRPRHRGFRRAGSLALAALALAALVALLVAPAFHVSRIDVSGNRRLTTAQVVAAAGLEHPGSVFQVDPGELRRRLTATTWVRAASVSAELPDRVRISVDEWQPSAVYRAAGGPGWYLSAEAVVLGPASDADAGGLLAIDGPGRPAPHTGRAPMDRVLLTALVNIQRSLPGILGQDVRSFAIDSCGNLTMVAGKGWKALFGRAITPVEVAALRDKVAALKSLAASGAVDLDTVQYVNVMNPAAVAVPGRIQATRPGRSTPSPSPSAAPQAAPQCA